MRELLAEIRNTATAVQDAAAELRSLDSTPGPTALHPDQLGAIAVLLALRWPAWVDRREVRIRFVDDSTVRITTTVSFHLTPEAVDADLAPGTRIYVPLDLPEKRTLLNLRIADEEGTLLTPLNMVRNADLSGRGLVVLFTRLLQDAGLELPADAAHALRKLPAVPTTAEAADHRDVALDSAGVLGGWLTLGGGRVRPEVQIIRQLTEGFLELVQIEYEPWRERRIELEHDVRLPWPEHPKWLLELGALSQQRTFKPVSIGRARSTHVEFVAPEDMDLVSSSLHGMQYDTLRDSYQELRVQAFSHERSRERAELHVALLAGSEIHNWTVIPPEAGRAMTPHEKRTQLQIEGASDSATATVSLLTRRSGTVPAAGIASIATAITLGLFASRLQELDGQTSAAVLLLLPAVLAAYLSRPGEHRFTTRALRAIRILAMISASCAIALSVMIAGGLLTTEVKPKSPASRQTANKPAGVRPSCLVTGMLGTRKLGARSHLRLSVSCNPVVPVASRAAGATAPARQVVPAAAQAVATALAAISGLIAFVLALTWGLATLQARSVPSDDELRVKSLIPGHPRPTP